MLLNRLCIILFLTIAILWGCKNKEDKTIQDYNGVFLSVTHNKLIEGKKYKTKLIFSMDTCSNALINAIIYRQKNKFYIKLLNPQTDYCVFFNLNSTQSEINTINVSFKKERDNFKTSIITENIVKLKGKEVYVFRIKNIFCYKGYKYDVVFFVTQESGVIGTYISNINKNGTEYIMYPEGNYLKDVLDYSDKIFTTLK